MNWQSDNMHIVVWLAVHFFFVGWRLMPVLDAIGLPPVHESVTDRPEDTDCSFKGWRKSTSIIVWRRYWEGGKGVLLLWRLLRKRAQTQLRHLQHPCHCTLGLRYKQTQHNTTNKQTQHNTTQQTQTQHEHLQHFCPSTLGSQWTEEMSAHINATRHTWTHSKVKERGTLYQLTPNGQYVFLI